MVKHGLGQIEIERLKKLIEDVKPSGGSEMSNYQLFVERLTGALGLPQPEFAREQTRFNEYDHASGYASRSPFQRSPAELVDAGLPPALIPIRPLATEQLT